MNSKPINVLLADDDTDDCSFFAKALEELPLHTNLSIVRSGEKLFKYLYENTEHLPDVIFLDISMPGKTGIECLSEIKENEALKDLRVVMFTISFPHNRDFEQSMKDILSKLGADYYISKTHDLEELKKAIQTAITSVEEKKAA